MPIPHVQPGVVYKVTPLYELVILANKFYPQSKRMQRDFIRMRQHLEETGRWLLSISSPVPEKVSNEKPVLSIVQS